MTRRGGIAVVLAGFAWTLAGRAPAVVAKDASADRVRAVYFSAVDGKGAAVAGLTAADLSVKEGGKDWPIASVEPATAPMQISVLVDDGGTGAFQAGLSQFLPATMSRGQIAIAALNPQPLKLTEFTNDVEALRAALGRLGPRGRVQAEGEQIIEAVAETSRDLLKRNAARPVILVLTIRGESVQSDRAQLALRDLKESGAALNVVFITGIELGKLLGDGPKQSGGMSEQAGSGPAIAPAMAKIADNLLHQYVLTYRLPDGTKPNERFALATSRKGVTLIAPTRLTDK